LPDGNLSHAEAAAFAQIVALAKDIAETYEDLDYNQLKDLAIENYRDEQ